MSIPSSAGDAKREKGSPTCPSEPLLGVFGVRLIRGSGVLGEKPAVLPGVRIELVTLVLSSDGYVRLYPDDEPIRGWIVGRMFSRGSLLGVPTIVCSKDSMSRVGVGKSSSASVLPSSDCNNDDGWVP